MILVQMCFENNDYMFLRDKQARNMYLSGLICLLVCYALNEYMLAYNGY